jgi:ABC-type sugar transport system ATPase subunit
MVFQNYALYPHKSVYENLAFGLRMRKHPVGEIEKKVQWAAQLLGIEGLLTRKPRQLSGGEMQRVSLGRALVRSPEVFLLDEPLSNLDAKLRIRMREEIVQLHNRVGINMVYVTHDQVEAMTMGDRIVVMRHGRIQQVGKPLEVYDSPANLFVAGFIGAPEMNLIKGELREDQGKLMFWGSGISIPVSTGTRRTARSGARSGEEVVLGIRPEHAIITCDCDEGIAATTTLVEQMGSHTLAVLELDGDPTSSAGARTPFRVLTSRRDELRVGERCRLDLRQSRIHLFDAVSGLSLT